MPAEWEPHAATWLAWPHHARRLARQVRADPLGLRRDRPPPAPARARSASSSTTRRREPGRPRRARRRAMSTSTGSRFTAGPTDRVWTRDSGPMFVVNDRTASGRVARLALQRLGEVPELAARRRDPRVASPGPLGAAASGSRRCHGRRVVLEGGSIDVNGHGLLLTTEECLLSEVQGRNPGLDRERLRAGLRRLPRRAEGALAEPRHRRRRHARPRRRPGPVRRPADGRRRWSRTTRPTRTTSRCRRTWTGCGG